MKNYRKILPFLITSIFIVTLIWDAYLYTLPSKTTVWNNYYQMTYGSILLIVGLTAVFHGVRYGLKSNLGKALFFLGLGFLSYLTGNVVWTFYTTVLQVEAPYPSFSDIFYSLFYPPMIIGTIYLVKVYKNLLTKAVLRDSLIIAVVLFIAVFGFFAKPDLSEGTPLLQIFLNWYYPFGSFAIGTIALISLRIGGGKMYAGLYIFAIGLAIHAVGDLLFAYRNTVGTYWNGDIADLTYTIDAFIMGMGLVKVMNSLTPEVKSSASPATQSS